MRRFMLAALAALSCVLMTTAGASQTVETMSAKYTGWSVGTGIYWTDEDGRFTTDPDATIGHSPGVAFSVPAQAQGGSVDLSVEDRTAALGLAPLYGRYVFTGGLVPIFSTTIEPIDYDLALYGNETLSSGTFCGGATSIPVPAGANSLFVSGHVSQSCGDPNPGTDGTVTARFWID